MFSELSQIANISFEYGASFSLSRASLSLAIRSSLNIDDDDDNNNNNDDDVVVVDDDDDVPYQFNNNNKKCYYCHYSDH